MYAYATTGITALKRLAIFLKIGATKIMGYLGTITTLAYKMSSTGKLSNRIKKLYNMLSYWKNHFHDR